MPDNQVTLPISELADFSEDTNGNAWWVCKICYYQDDLGENGSGVETALAHFREKHLTN